MRVWPETGWTVVTEKQRPRNSTDEFSPRGLHGFDNQHPLMRAMFVARGPAFRHLHGEGREWLALEANGTAKRADGRRVELTKGVVRAGRVAPFQNTEVYRIICQSLGIAQAANNATLDALTLIGDEAEEEEEDAKLPSAAPATSSLRTVSSAARSDRKSVV